MNLESSYQTRQQAPWFTITFAKLEKIVIGMVAIHVTESEECDWDEDC